MNDRPSPTSTAPAFTPSRAVRQVASLMFELTHAHRRFDAFSTSLVQRLTPYMRWGINITEFTVCRQGHHLGTGYLQFIDGECSEEALHQLHAALTTGDVLIITPTFAHQSVVSYRAEA